MKIMIASDLHGSADAAAKLTDTFARHAPEKLILLGDLLYHGPRNDLPEGYDPRETARLLNSLSSRILAVRGNCDSEVDQMMLEFPIMSDYALWYDEGRVIFTTHGHVWNRDHLPPLSDRDILLHGHTHVPAAGETSPVVCLNPGSAAIPKEGWPASYMLYEDGLFRVLQLDNDDELLRWQIPERD